MSNFQKLESSWVCLVQAWLIFGLRIRLDFIREIQPLRRKKTRIRNRPLEKTLYISFVHFDNKKTGNNTNVVLFGNNILKDHTANKTYSRSMAKKTREKNHNKILPALQGSKVPERRLFCNFLLLCIFPPIYIN